MYCALYVNGELLSSTKKCVQQFTPSLPADVLWGSFVTHSYECVTNEPQRTSAGRLGVNCCTHFFVEESNSPLTYRAQYIVEALVGGHSRDVKKVSVARAGRLRECKNTEFVWEMRKTGFCERGHWVDLSACESVRWESFHRTLVSSMTSFLIFLFCCRSSFAVDGVNCTVNKDVEQVIKTFHAAKKPIG